MAHGADPATAGLDFLDITAPGFSVRSPAVRAARARGWCARTPYGLAVLRYEEMRELILHPAVDQGSHRWPDLNGASGLWAQWWKRIMLNRTGADHLRLRRLGTPAFAPRRVGSLIPVFQGLADELVSGFAARGRCEVMAEFAEPYATRVICALIGIPQGRWRTLADIAAEMGLALGVDYARSEPRIDAATARLLGYAGDLVAERRAEPRDDFIGDLIAANEDKDALSDQELVDMIVLSIFGGIETTRNQLGLALQMFLEHPDQWRRLGEAPELARQAVEEVMRLRPTTTWVTREAMADFAFRGLHIARGTTLHLFSESAGSDPEHFEPGFDIGARRKPHFGFGGGKHHCIGSPVARGDMAEALKLMARRMRNLAPDGAARFLPDSGNTGPIVLPVRFDPETAEGPQRRSNDC